VSVFAAASLLGIRLLGEKPDEANLIGPKPPAQQEREIRPERQGLDKKKGTSPGTGADGTAAEPSGEPGRPQEAVATAGRIFYSTTEDNVNSWIWVMDADGTGRKRMAVGRMPDPSFDGSRVAFVRGDEGCQVSSSVPYDECREIWVMNGDGSDQRMIGRGDQPDWSPDGGRIAFTRWTSEGDETREWAKGDVYIMNADGSHVRKLPRSPTYPPRSRPRWSPDGRWIAFASPVPSGNSGCNGGFYVIEVDGPGDENLDGPGCRSGGASWSPDGKQIVFWSSRGANTFDIGIYVMNLDGSDIRRLTPQWDGDGPRSALYPSWSPDSSRIAYMFDADGEMPGPGWHCHGGGQSQIAYDCQPSGPGKGALYVMNADGSHPTRLVDVGTYPEFSS
jgi:Tol biopolymer transport system component